MITINDIYAMQERRAQAKRDARRAKLTARIVQINSVIAMLSDADCKRSDYRPFELLIEKYKLTLERNELF